MRIPTQHIWVRTQAFLISPRHPSFLYTS